MAAAKTSAESDRIENILRRFEKPLLQFATRILGDPERARDVVQETFVKFQRNGASEQPEPATWLFTVCRNGALNVCRKERRLTFVDDSLLETRDTESPMPFDRIELDEASGFLLRIVATLPPRQQEVLQLKFQNDLSYQQIAEIIQTNANNVGVLIHTALKTLRQKYSAASKDFLPFEPRTT
jgi:RNA polymerase sigma factor (sigma-70 family)